ncbi:MAG TPA: GNAT family N-acetyltransferase [Solirubrobacterales bacterium]
MTATPFEIRELVAADLPAVTLMTQLAFGSLGSKPAEREWTRYVAVTPAGEILGTASDLHRHHWWGGHRVSAADVSHVAVLPEARGQGIAGALMAALLEGARDRGAAVSTLFATVAAVYRASGWGAVGTRHLAEFPTAILPVHRRDPDLIVRAGGPADRVAAGELYTAVARSRNGMQCREVAPWGPAGYLDEDVHGITVVEDSHGMAGFASWRSGEGHDADAVLTVVDLVATNRDATRELLAVLGSSSAVAPTTRFRAILTGVVAGELPMAKAGRHRIDPLMHRVVDVVRAVDQRGWPVAMRATASFDLVDKVCPWNSGSWEVEIADGKGRIGRTAPRSGLRLDVQGLAVLLTGAMSPSMLVEAGLLAVDPGADPAPLAGLMSGPAAESLDFF